MIEFYRNSNPQPKAAQPEPKRVKRKAYPSTLIGGRMTKDAKNFAFCFLYAPSR
jgi:hypothetical protein